MVSGSVAVLFLGLAVVPMILMFEQSLVVDHRFSLQRYQTLFFDGRIISLFTKSVVMALGATILSLMVGLPLAYSLVRTEFFARKLASVFYLIPLFIPPHIHALAWIYFFGEKGAAQLLLSKLFGLSTTTINLYTPAGTAFTLFLAYCPILVVVVMTGLGQIDRRLEEAASFHASPLTVWRKITLPLLAPYLIAGSIFVFILSFFNYGVPSMLRVMSFPVEILTRFSAFYDAGGAVALATPMVLLATLLLLLYKQLFVNKSVISIGGDSTHHRRDERLQNRLAPIYVWIYVLITVVLPLAVLFKEAGSIRIFLAAWRTSATEIITSFGLAIAAATLATIFAYLLGRALEGNTCRKKLLDFLTLLPLAFPAPLFGIGFIHLWNRPATEVVYACSAILVLAYMARFLPFGTRIVSANLAQISPTTREAAYLYQSSACKRLWRIELPLVKRGLVMSWIVIFIFSMGELGATLLLVPPGSGTLSLKIYTLMHYGAGSLVAALSLILVLTSLLTSFLLLRFYDSNEYERKQDRFSNPTAYQTA